MILALLTARGAISDVKKLFRKTFLIFLYRKKKSLPNNLCTVAYTKWRRCFLSWTHVIGFYRNYRSTGFREDFPSVRVCGLKERTVMPRSWARFFTKIVFFLTLHPSPWYTRKMLSRETVCLALNVKTCLFAVTFSTAVPAVFSGISQLACC